VSSECLNIHVSYELWEYHIIVMCDLICEGFIMFMCHLNIWIFMCLTNCENIIIFMRCVRIFEYLCFLRIFIFMCHLIRENIHASRDMSHVYVTYIYLWHTYISDTQIYVTYIYLWKIFTCPPRDMSVTCLHICDIHICDIHIYMYIETCLAGDT